MDTLKILRRAFAVFILATLLPSVQGQSASSGSLTGIISNKATRNNLEGAVVEIPALGRRTQSDSTGRYTLNDLPSGTHRVVVSYTGIDDVEASLAVAPGTSRSHDFALTSTVYELETFTVTSEREGNAASITKQRNANNVVNVVSTDAYGNVGEGNLGNFLQRLPGVATNNEVGDITGIIVRGAPPSWNAVNVDGTRASSANASSNIGDMGRATVIDQIPADFIKEIELTKAPTPDMSADSIGGNANLITKSALDIKGNRLSYRASGNVNTFRRDDRNVTPSGSLTYLGKLGTEEKYGIALSASYTAANNTRDRVQMTRNTEEEFTTQARTLNDDILRVRAGIGGKLDIQVSEDTRVRLGLYYSQFHFDQDRSDWNITGVARVADYSVVSRAAIEGGAVPRTSTNQTAGIAPGFSQEFTELLNANYSNTEGREVRDSESLKYEFSGETALEGSQKLDYSVSFSPSKYDFVYQSMLAQLNGRVGLSVDGTADKDRPIYAQTYGSTIGTGANWKSPAVARFQSNERYSEEDVTDIRVNYLKQFTESAFRPELKTGIDWRRQYRSFDSYFPRWDYVGPVGGSKDMTKFVLNSPGYGLFNNAYPLRDHLDFAGFKDAFASHPEEFKAMGTTVSDGILYNNASEDVAAAYIMGTMTVSDWTLLGGVRYEETKVDAHGSLSDPLKPGVADIDQSGKYDNLFPSVHLKYEPRKGLIFRGSFSTGIARPAHADLYPNTTVTYDDDTGLGRVNQNDPALGPQNTKNYDLTAEYYFEPVGVISAGYFYKEITDFIGREDVLIGDGAGNGFGGDYEGFTLRTTKNFGEATIEGFELNYNQQLTMLPGVLSGLGIYANYTKIKTQGEYDDSGTDELVQFVPEMANFGVSWRYKALTLAAKYNFQAGILRSFNADPLRRQRTTDTATWDFNARYNFSQKYAVYLDVINAFNEWPSWYTGKDSGRVIMSEVYGTRVSFGITGSF